MLVSQPTLEQLLLHNVLDVRFVRRIPIAGKSLTRRMLCTKSFDLLNTTNGKIVLNYYPPKHQKQVNEAAMNLCVVWDLLMQNYRQISVDAADVIRQIPADESFWKVFNNEILPMTTAQKIQYMDS